MRTGRNVITNNISLISIYLRIIVLETDYQIATGTGFLYTRNGWLYLITNGHNVTGVNPETGERLSKHAAIPGIIKSKIYVETNKNSGGIGRADISFQLYEDEDLTAPKWLMHPKNGYKVDVVAIPVCQRENVPMDLKTIPVNEYKFDDKFPLMIADTVFILGYPFNISVAELPIWKKGTIASEPNFDVDNLPKILVDTATRSGMSGSPVIFQRVGVHGFSGEMTGEEIVGTITGFVGVYSGRIGTEDEMKAQLGIVWRKEVIDEIIDGQVSGTIDFQKM